MRKITTYSIALTIALAAVGCTKELEMAEPGGRIDQGGEIIFFASNENDDIYAQTRTVLGNDGLKVTFVDGDAIKIYDGTNNGNYTTNSEQDGYRMFSGTGLNTDAASYYAVYPATAAGGYAAGQLTATIPAAQTAPLNSFDPAANVSVAKGDKIETGKYNLKFKNVGNLLKFTFTADSEVSAIIIKSNDATPLVGTARINPETGVYDTSAGITDGSNQITLRPKGSSTFLKGDYYAVVLPNTYAAGVSVRMNHSGGSYHFKRGGVTNQVLERNKIYKLFSSPDLNNFTEAGMLPSLFLINSLKTATRISFHANAIDADWEYANANNQLNILGDSDVRGYIFDDGVEKVLHIYTKKGMFGIPEGDVLSYTDGSQMFNGYAKVTAIDNLSYIDMTFIQDYNNFFSGCNKLKSIDISEWDTSSATNMANMFSTNSSSELKNVILGEWFVLDEKHSNMFGPVNRDDAHKIRVSCPESVYDQFVAYEGVDPFNNHVTWNSGDDAVLFGEFLNPTVRASLKGAETVVTFTMSGNAPAPTSVIIGMNGYTPASGSAYYANFEDLNSSEVHDGTTYNMYRYYLTGDQRDARRCILDLKAQSTHLNPSSVYLSAPIYGETSAESHIYDVSYSGAASAINDIFFVNKQGRVSFSLQSTVEPGADAGSVTSAYLSNGTRLYLCVADGVDAEGNTIYTSKDAFVISDTRELKTLKVLVEVDNHRTYEEISDITLKVCDYSIGSTATTTAPSSFDSNQIYVLKYQTGRYLGVEDTNGALSVITSTTPDNTCFWTFKPGTASACKLASFYANNLKYLTSSVTLSDSGNTLKAVTGLKFSVGSNYLGVSGTNPFSPTFSASYKTFNWSLYPVTVTEP